MSKKRYKTHTYNTNTKEEEIDDMRQIFIRHELILSITCIQLIRNYFNVLITEYYQ